MKNMKKNTALNGFDKRIITVLDGIEKIKADYEKAFPGEKSLNAIFRMLTR